MKKNVTTYALITAGLIGLLSLSNCTKTAVKEDTEVSADATVIDAGLPSADGCGWMLKIDTNYYSPVNLPEKYKQNDLSVKVVFTKLNTRYQCGLAAHLQYYNVVINSIRLR